MLNGAGINIDKGIKTLSDNQEELLKFMQATGFNPGNISAMLGGVGSNVERGMRELLQEILKDSGLQQSNISNILNAACVNIGDRILMIHKKQNKVV